MKKIRLISCTVMLGTILAGNVFATSTISTGSIISGLFTSIVVSVELFLRGNDENCRPRQCTSCKPNERDDDGNCRPPAN